MLRRSGSKRVILVADRNSLKKEDLVENNDVEYCSYEQLLKINLKYALFYLIK